MAKKPRLASIKKGLPGFIFGAVFLIVGVWSIVTATGYKINLQNGAITQTAAIVLSGSASNVTVKLDGSVVGNKISTLQGISAGQHNVNITSPGYQDWQESFRLDPGEAALNEHVELFLTAPTILSNQTDNAVLDGIEVVDSTLKIVDTEIYQVESTGNILITRFSQPILSATRSNDQQHIFLQIGKSIYVTELQGENTAKLIDLSDAAPTPLLPKQNDSQLVLKNAGVTQTWQIR